MNMNINSTYINTYVQVHIDIHRCYIHIVFYMHPCLTIFILNLYIEFLPHYNLLTTQLYQLAYYLPLEKTGTAWYSSMYNTSAAKVPNSHTIICLLSCILSNYFANMNVISSFLNLFLVGWIQVIYSLIIMASNFLVSLWRGKDYQGVESYIPTRVSRPLVDKFSASTVLHFKNTIYQFFN